MKLRLISILIAFSQVTAFADEATKAFDASIDHYTKLRVSVYGSTEYSPAWGNEDERNAAIKLHEEEKLVEFIEASDAWLKKMPIDIQMHYVRSFALLRLGRHSEYARSFAIYTGLIASVMSKGDGRTPETAFPVISTKEEYAVLNELRLDFVEQSLEQGRDKMKCKDVDGNEVFVYFDVSAILKKYRETLKPDKAE